MWAAKLSAVSCSVSKRAHNMYNSLQFLATVSLFHCNALPFSVSIPVFLSQCCICFRRFHSAQLSCYIHRIVADADKRSFLRICNVSIAKGHTFKYTSFLPSCSTTCVQFERCKAARIRRRCPNQVCFETDTLANASFTPFPI